MQNTAVYEFPLNERMRIFMRLENSFAQIAHFSAGGNIWDSQASLLVLLDILNILDKHDIKSEIIKELERYIAVLSSLLDIPNIARHKLEKTLTELNETLLIIQKINASYIKSLRDDDLLATIKQRTSISQTPNHFDIPSYYYWLNQSAHLRQEQIIYWLTESLPIADAISLILDLVRSSADFNSYTAEAGFFQTALNAQQNCQMLRISLPQTTNIFPEAGGNKNRISIRFLNYANMKQRPTQMTESILFDLSCCGI